MTTAPTVVSTASTLIGRHAQLAGLAAERGMVSKTLTSGIRLASASSTGGYGEAGAWGLVRRISVGEFQTCLEKLARTPDLSPELWADLGGTVDNAASRVLEDGRTPLWHVVIEDMHRERNVITEFFVVQDIVGLLQDHLKERVFDFVFDEGGAADFTGDDLEHELLNARELLRVCYEQHKVDSRWKGQLAYKATVIKKAQRTFLNALCDHGRFDLLPAVLKFKHEGEHGRAKPYFVLADVGFGNAVLEPRSGRPHATMRADNYGNSPLHVCAYVGNARTLAALLEHIEAIAESDPVRFRVLAQFVRDGQQKDGETVLKTAARAGNWACWGHVASFLERHRLGPVRRPANFVERDVDNAQETSARIDDDSCEFMVPYVGTFTMADLADLESTCLEVERAAPRGTARSTLQVKKLLLRDLPGDDLRQVVGKLLRFALQFKEVRFTRSHVDTGAMHEILRALAQWIHDLAQRDDERDVCEKLTLGMQPCEDDTEALEPAQLWSVLSAMAQLLPARRCMAITVQGTWGERLATPGSAFLLHLFDALGDVLKVARRNRGKAVQLKKLEANPLMPGLCRVRLVAFKGWKRLCDAETITDAVHPETLPFLRALGAVWQLCEAALPRNREHGQINPYLQQARRFLHRMEPLVGGATLDLDAFATGRGAGELSLADRLTSDFDRCFAELFQA